ncbi:acyl--CoA ligase [Gleimia sp. 6138-11-ORH1]|uniref:class I adenylate-forming enzyme family protein n=1 Tax=Gleimia sp. 6138-11-ORH1 TaxID=2973937 RepID=UPI002166C1A4|nr:class I adenylate-forming enzyme family protein [Gleimia sp. 6138-11-ORH1]MCS4485163.1 acyl--CoA ligase [Gleimia sp. 6138-11-ORH1]
MRDKYSNFPNHPPSGFSSAAPWSARVVCEPDYSPLNLLLKAAVRNPHRLHLVGVAPPERSIFSPLVKTDSLLPQAVASAQDFEVSFVSSVSQSADLALRLVSLLQAHGVKAGDRVAVWGPNSVWHLLVHIACAGLGAISVQLDQHYTAEEFALVTEDCKPRLVFAGPEQSKRLAAVFPEHSESPQQGPLETARINDFAVFALPQLAETVADYLPFSVADLPVLDASTVGAIIYTSGTASHPKGVALTHANLWWGCRNFREVFEYSSDFVEAVVAPLSHIGGFNGTTLDLVYSGGTVVVIEGFAPATVLEVLDVFKVQMMFGVPTIYLRLLDDPSFTSRDLSAFVRPLIGGASLPVSLAQRLHAVGWAPYNVWGMTEQAASGTCLTPSMAPNCENGIGIPFPYTRVRVARLAGDKPLLVENELVDTAPNEIGMLVCAGPSVSSGYWQDDALNASSFVGPWLLTGDLGYLTETGTFQFAARAAQTINTGGEKVLPDAVAEVLQEIPGVAQVQVVGIADSQWGQIVAAVLIPEFSAEGDWLKSLPESTVLKQLRTLAAKSLARYKLPRAVRVVDSFPVSSNGKVSQTGLQELFK